jgi:hypothetical protein
MRIIQRYGMLSMVMALGLFFNVAAHADEANQQTIITFSAPIQIPGVVLPAGTYMFQLADEGNDGDMVQVFNSEGTKLYATLQTNATDRQRPTDNTAVTLAAQGPGTPDALLNWYYPGELTGHEFVYPTQEEKKLAQDQPQTIVANQKPANSAVQAGE